MYPRDIDQSWSTQARMGVDLNLAHKQKRITVGMEVVEEVNRLHSFIEGISNRSLPEKGDYRQKADGTLLIGYEV
jgi:hypothetical protein